jgi:hypothetical protein
LVFQTADSQGKTLQYYGLINFDVNSVHSLSMLKAFVGIIPLAETAPTWFHTSPTSAKVPSTVFLLYRQEAMQQFYQELITRVPLVKLLGENGDSIALEALYNNVRAHVHHFGITQ